MSSEKNRRNKERRLSRMDKGNPFRISGGELMRSQILQYRNLLSVIVKVVAKLNAERCKAITATKVASTVRLQYVNEPDMPPAWLIRSMLKKPYFTLTDSGWTLTNEEVFPVRRVGI